MCLALAHSSVCSAHELLYSKALGNAIGSSRVKTKQNKKTLHFFGICFRVCCLWRLFVIEQWVAFSEQSQQRLIHATEPKSSLNRDRVFRDYFQGSVF